MDLRQHLRFLIHCAISLKINDHSESGKVHNLSLAGCGAESVEAFQVGERLAVLIHLPDGTPPMKVDLATVRWANGQQFGLEFVHLRPEERERLREFLDTLDTGATQ